MENTKNNDRKVHENKVKLQQVEMQTEFFGKTQTAYYFVNRTSLSPMERFIINYILNFTQNGNGCNTPYMKIAFAGNFKYQSVEVCISNLTKRGLILKGKQIHNKDKKGSYIEGGLWVDLDKLIENHNEYNSQHPYEDMVADYEKAQAEKKRKRDKKLAEKDAEIQRLNEIIAQQGLVQPEAPKEQPEPIAEANEPMDIPNEEEKWEEPKNFHSYFSNGPKKEEPKQPKRETKYVIQLDEEIIDVMDINGIHQWLKENGGKLTSPEAMEKDIEEKGHITNDVFYNGEVGKVIIRESIPVTNIAI